MKAEAIDDAYVVLRHAILELDLTPGQQVSERSLSDELNVSRTPVRTALTRLLEEGLVERYQRSWRVTPIDVDDVEHAMHFRQTVELGALELTLSRVTAASLKKLTAEVEASFRKHQDAIHDCDMFHKHLVELSGNPYLSRALDDVLTRLARPRWVAAQDDGARSVARDEHLRLVSFLLEGDQAGARATLIEHISGLRGRLISTLIDERKRLRVFSIHNR